MLKNGLTILSIVVIASVLSACKHVGFPEAPAYRECGVGTLDTKGEFVAAEPQELVDVVTAVMLNPHTELAKSYVVYCEWMNANHPSETYPFSASLVSQFLMTPTKDVPKLERYEAEVKTWVDQRCK